MMFRGRFSRFRLLLVEYVSVLGWFRINSGLKFGFRNLVVCFGVTSSLFIINGIVVCGIRIGFWRCR